MNDHFILNTTQPYFDCMATTPLAHIAQNAMLQCQQQHWRNASANYGQQGQNFLEEAKASLLSIINSDAHQTITWTSGATEALNLAITGYFNRYAQPERRHIVTSCIEHAAVARTIEQLNTDVTYVMPGTGGLLNADDVLAACRADTCMICLHHINSELGTIQPLAEILPITHQRGIIGIVDAAQSLGKATIEAQQWQADCIALSAHKCFGPKGIGALYHRTDRQPEPILFGGQQQSNRSGTIAIPLIAGMVAAVKWSEQHRNEHHEHILSLRKQFYQGLTGTEAIYQHHPSQCVPHVQHITLAEAPLHQIQQLMTMIDCSQWSSCTKQVSDSVLIRLGKSIQEAQRSLRISFGPYNTEQEIHYLIKLLKTISRTEK